MTLIGDSTETDQGALLRHVSELRERFRGKGYAWNKLRGDAYARLVSYYLSKALLPGLSLVANGWVEGSGIEFDLLVVDKDAEPVPFTNSFPKRRVRLLIEVKGSGYFYKKVDTAERVTRQRERVRIETGKPILFLLLRESERNSQSVLRGIGIDDAFILRIGKREIPGEWTRFVERVNVLCTTA